MASPMNHRRCGHGMGIINVNGEERLAVFGGYGGYGGSDLRNVELYNTETLKWELAENVTLNVSRTKFGFVNV